MSRRIPKAAPCTPPMPPPTEAEIAQERQILRMLQEGVIELRQRNLDRAVQLAHRAAAGQLDEGLTEYFGELGRRFGALLDAPPVKPKLRLVRGGRKA